MAKVVIVMTCFNRKAKTINCLEKLHKDCNENECRFIVVDDKSKDGTKEAIEALGYEDVEVIDGTGSLFWNGGMHRGVEVAFEKYADMDYCLLVNDDVDFYPGVIDRLVTHARSRANNTDEIVVVGPTKDDKGQFSYGGIKYTHGIKYEMLGPDRSDVELDTFNANCTMIPGEVMRKVGNLDPYYKHSLGDFDLGLRISKSGVKMYVFPEYVGDCNDNPKDGTWMDSSLGVRKRIKLKESFKGLPFGDWFHYLNKHFGFGTACVRSVTPYVKIFLHR